MSPSTDARGARPFLILLLGWIALAASPLAINTLYDQSTWLDTWTVQERALLGILWSGGVAFFTSMLYLRHLPGARPSRKGPLILGFLGVGVTVALGFGVILLYAIGV